MSDRPGEERDHVGRRFGSLEHCALHRRTIRLSCPRCLTVRRADAVGLWWLFRKRRWSDMIPACWRRLYCKSCLVASGRKIAPRVEITTEAPDRMDLPYPDEREWRRLVSRYRS